MRKIKGIFLTIILTMLMIGVASIIIPELGQAMWMMVAQLFWPVFKILFLKDELSKIGVFLILLLIISGGSLYASKRTENKLWYYAGAILDVISLIVLFS